MNDDIHLIALDWGSTHVRAFALAADGRVLAQRKSGQGALTLRGDAAFGAALSELVADWAAAAPRARLIACGMVGAKTGWREAPYAECGADAAQLAAQAIAIETPLGRPLHIVPGIKSAEPDVIRGEETQLIGAGLNEGTLVLPGTHSKWVRMQGGVVAEFATFYTGEMNALLRQHASVGMALAGAEPDPTLREAFAAGVAQARSRPTLWLHELFVLRAAVVAGSATPAEASTRLSGWLLGSELTGGLALYPQTRSIALIASNYLLPWYQAASVQFGIECRALDGEAATSRGLFLIGSLLP